MAKRKRMPGPERKDQIAQIAARMFAEKGFAGTAVKTIADRARVSEPMIFKLFGSKAGLIEHLPNIEEIAQLHVKFHADLAERAAADDDEGVFGLIATTVLKYYVKDATFLRLSLFCALERQPTAEAMFHERAEMFFSFLAGYIKRRIDAGAFADVDPDIAARAFVGMIVYFILIRQIFDERGSQRIGAERAAATFTEIFLNGIRKQ